MVIQIIMLSFQNKEIRKDLAPLLWNSIGTISALLQVRHATWLHQMPSAPRLSNSFIP